MRMKTHKATLRKKASVLTIGVTIIALLEHKIVLKFLGNTAAETNNPEKQIYSSFFKRQKIFTLCKTEKFPQGETHWAQLTIASISVFYKSFKNSEEKFRHFLVPSIIKVRQQH